MTHHSKSTKQVNGLASDINKTHQLPQGRHEGHMSRVAVGALHGPNSMVPTQQG